MIDQCIYEVYQKDKKVFIPEFGAIIYSEFNDEVDFNELLTFDDGKVIEEIQKQQSISEDEARKALDKYVQKIKSAIDKGKSHYIEGIGHLVKDEQGSLMLQQEKLKNETPKKTKKSAPPVVEEPVAEEEPAVEIPETTDLFEEETVHETQVFEKTPIFPPEENEDDETVFMVEEENTFAYEEEIEIQETEPKEGGGLKLAFLIVIPLLLIAAGVFYYFNYYSADATSETSSQVESTESIPEKAVLESTTQSAETAKPENINSTPVTVASNPQLDQEDENKTFCLIMGSFKVERNADKYQRRLKQKGLDSNKFKGRKNFYFVGIQGIDGKSNAVKKLEEIKSKVPSAWIYNKDLLL